MQMLIGGAQAGLFRERFNATGELVTEERARGSVPDGSMDVVITNPWFSTKETIGDEAILRRHRLGHVWTRTEEGQFVNTGAVKSIGLFPGGAIPRTGVSLG